MGAGTLPAMRRGCWAGRGIQAASQSPAGSPWASQIQAGNSRVKPHARGKQKITVGSFVRGGNRETLRPLCAEREGCQQMHITGGFLARRRVCPPCPVGAGHADPAAAHRCNAEATLGSSRCPSHHCTLLLPQPPHRIRPGLTAGYSYQQTGDVFPPW